MLCLETFIFEKKTQTENQQLFDGVEGLDYLVTNCSQIQPLLCTDGLKNCFKTKNRISNIEF